MIITALDVKNAEYTQVEIIGVKHNKKGKIRSLTIRKDDSIQLYLKKGKTLFYNSECTLSINPGDLKGVAL